MATLTDSQLELIVDRLRGQCLLSLEDVLEQMDLDYWALDRSDHSRIDDRVFLCDCCGWWCETEELNNETSRDLCDQCVEEGED